MWSELNELYQLADDADYVTTAKNMLCLFLSHEKRYGIIGLINVVKFKSIIIQKFKLVVCMKRCAYCMFSKLLIHLASCTSCLVYKYALVYVPSIICCSPDKLYQILLKPLHQNWFLLKHYTRIGLWFLLKPLYQNWFLHFIQYNEPFI